MSNSDTRPTLLERLRQASDPVAWDEFFDRYGRVIYALARHRGCSEHTAEEIIQDVMLALFERRDVFRYDSDRGRFRDWLAAVVRNKVAEHRRRPAQRARPQGGDGNSTLTEPEDSQTPPDAACEAAFERGLLAALLDVIRREINPRTYQAFELFTLHELSGAQVARITGLSRNAVYQARKKVFQRLDELGAAYRREGRLDRRVKQALESLPGAAAERSLTARVARTMRSL